MDEQHPATVFLTADDLCELLSGSASDFPGSLASGFRWAMNGRIRHKEQATAMGGKIRGKERQHPSPNRKRNIGRVT
jgi:hypothetical protein